MKPVIKSLAIIICVLMTFSSAACGSKPVENPTDTVGASSNVQESTSDTESEADTLKSTEEESFSISDTESNEDTDMETESSTGSDIETETETETETEIETDVAITEKNGEADVSTKHGIEYHASNYSAVDNKAFKINQGFTVTFSGEEFSKEFNRFAIEYKSSAPLKIDVTYTVDGEERTDYYYVEAIKTSFRGIVETYFDGKNSTEIKKIVFSTCEKVDADFMLYDLTLETVDFYPDDLYVENERFKIGVRLTWGGSMTYFEDKNDGIADLGNLVNIHDTGRLIQQSFYGTYTNDEYTSGSYSDSTWPYNPVQGGNKYQTGRTRLIDVEVGDDYIYVKAQSLDWALNNVLTHTYYENTYTLTEDNVHVDNRMVDFSGWKHSQNGQEIPAMYIVSYFGTLAYYNGAKPWTDDIDGIYYERKLGGWSASVTVPLLEGNDETWAIWMNEDDNFCFGIYAPNIDRLVAIRHLYDGSKDPMSNSCSYVAPSAVVEMVSYFPIEYQYLLATGTFEDVREEFKENKDFSDNASLDNNRAPLHVSAEKFDMTDLDFTKRGTEKVFNGPKKLKIDYDGMEQAVKFTLTDVSDPYAFIDFYWNSDKELVAEDFNVFEIEYMIPTTNSKTGYYLVLFLCAGDIKSPKEGYTATTSLVADGQYHTVCIRLPKDRWNGDIHKIRVDILDSGAIGDEIFVKHIRLLKYPDLGAENDLSIPYADKLISSPARTKVEFSEVEQGVVLKVLDKNDVGVQLDFSNAFLSADNYKTIEITYMIPTTNSKTSYSYQFFFTCAGSGGFAEARSVTGQYTADGKYHTLTVTFDGKEGWSGAIKKIRFDYFSGCAVDDVIYIKSINLK